MAEDNYPLAVLLLVIEAFKDCAPRDPVAAVAGPGDEVLELTFGHLRALAKALLADRDRANLASRDAADQRDLLAAARGELEDLRERHAEVVAERDALSVELDDERSRSEETER